MFSLNFSSAGKEPLMDSKAKNMHQRHIFPGEEGKGGSGVRDTAPPSVGNLGAKFSETFFPHLDLP